MDITKVLPTAVRLLLGVATAISATLLLALNLGWQPFAPPTVALEIHCADLAAACRFKLNDQTYTIKTNTALSGNRPIRLTLTGPSQTAHASWQMANMSMGPNRYALQTIDHLHWQADTLLPLCSQARRDWLLKLEIDKQTVLIHTQ